MLNKKHGYALTLIALLVAPQVLYPVLLMKFLCFALFACAYNLLAGYTRLLSFGHAALFGGSAYMAGWAVANLGFSLEFALLLGAATGAALGLVMGALAIRRDGVYSTMITLALAQLLYFVWLQVPFTGGEDGLQGVPVPKLLGVVEMDGSPWLYYLVLLVAVAGFALVARIVDSPYGQVLRAIKDNEARAISLGYDVNRYKLLVFVLSAALCGVAGAMKTTLVLGIATLNDVHWTMSGMAVLMCLIGGMGTLAGPVVGAAVLVALESKLGDLGAWLASTTGVGWFNALGESTGLVTGLLFIVAVLAFRRGIVGELWARCAVKRVVP